MLTRSFLFLLAILTGMVPSAANAAQPHQAAMGSMTETASSGSLPLTVQNDARSYARYLHPKKHGFFESNATRFTFGTQHTIVLQRTYRGDRAHE